VVPLAVARDEVALAVTAGAVELRVRLAVAAPVAAVLLSEVNVALLIAVELANVAVAVTFATVAVEIFVATAEVLATVLTGIGEEAAWPWRYTEMNDPPPPQVSGADEAHTVLHAPSRCCTLGKADKHTHWFPDRVP